MSTILLSMDRRRAASTALRTGVALAITATVLYTLCTFIWLVAPVAFMNFMNGLFHGIDFSPLLSPAPFSWTGYFEAVVVMSVWALLAGTLFGWVRQRLGS